MPKSKHTRKCIVRKHTNNTFGSHLNGKRIGLKKGGYDGRK